MAVLPPELEAIALLQEIAHLALEHGYEPSRDQPVALLDWLAACLAERAAAVARANQLPGLTATLDEYRRFAGLVREALAQHDAANGTLSGVKQPDGSVTALVRKALSTVEGSEPMRCSRCSHVCLDSRLRHGERVCILCVERELEQERANGAAMRARLAAATAIADAARPLVRADHVGGNARETLVCTQAWVRLRDAVWAESASVTDSPEGE